jgi:hypothetical protein
LFVQLSLSLISVLSVLCVFLCVARLAPTCAEVEGDERPREMKALISLKIAQQFPLEKAVGRRDTF